MSVPVFKIRRSFDAPLSLVWEVYSREEHLARWWGPKGFEWVSGKLDFRPGGIFHYGMRAPTGDMMWGKFGYREIVPMEKLVFTSSFSDETGATRRAPFAADFPAEVLNTLRFSEAAGKTTIDMTGTPFDASDAEKAFFESMFPSMNQGFTGTLNQLEDYLRSVKTVRELVLTRIYDAPRALVFEAFTDPAHIARWWGPKGFTNVVRLWEAKPGGRIDLDMVAPDGNGHPMGGTIHEVSPPDRFVFTSTAFWDADGTPGIENYNIVTFEDLDGKTRMTLRCQVLRASPAIQPALDGMEQGWNQSLDRLGDLVSRKK